MTMVKYISFTGCQNSGKSTLMNELFKKLKEKNYRVVRFPSTTRYLIGELNLNLKELRKSKEGLKVWQYFTLKEHLEMLKELDFYLIDYVITDRCYIDFLVYTEITIDKNYKEFLKDYFKDDIKIFNNKSIIINTAPLNNFDKIEDGVRDSSTFNEEVKLFEKYKNKYDLILPPTNIEERLNMVLNYLNI